MDIQPNEKLFLARRRAGETLPAAAARLGVPLKEYVAMEKGTNPTPRKHLSALGKVSVEERCLLTRRRQGRTLANVAAELGLCVFTVRRMEQGRINSERLAKHLKV